MRDPLISLYRMPAQHDDGAADEAELFIWWQQLRAYDEDLAALDIRVAKASVSLYLKWTSSSDRSYRIIKKARRLRFNLMAWRSTAPRRRKTRNMGLSTTVADVPVSAKPQIRMTRRLARSHEVLITVEEGSIGGFAKPCFISGAGRPA